MPLRTFNLGAAALVGILGGFALKTAHAEGATVTLSGVATSSECAGGLATLNGNGNTVTFRKACQALTVNGNGNTVQVELHARGLITLNGAGNRVGYVPVGGSQDATVADHGQGNAVARQSALTSNMTAPGGNAPSSGGVSIHGANGEAVQIGPNGVFASPTPGAGGAVAVAPGGATVITPGAGVPPAAAETTPGELMLSGDYQNRDAVCGGAKVFISGDNGQFTLRGGCKALYIHGDHDVIHAEMVPGTEIGIQGDNELVYLLLTAPGPNPKLLVRGDNSRAYVVQHIDDTTGTEISAGGR